MEDTKKEENKKETPKEFNLKIKALVALLASGAFAKLHRRFLAPSSKTDSDEQVFNLFYYIRRFLAPSSETYWGEQAFTSLHHILHSLIGLGIQIVLFLWVINFIITAGKPVCGGIKSVWKKRKFWKK